MSSPSILGTNLLWRAEPLDEAVLDAATPRDRSGLADARLRLLARARGDGVLEGLEVSATADGLIVGPGLGFDAAGGPVWLCEALELDLDQAPTGVPALLVLSSVEQAAGVTQGRPSAWRAEVRASLWPAPDLLGPDAPVDPWARRGVAAARALGGLVAPPPVVGLPLAALERGPAGGLSWLDPWVGRRIHADMGGAPAALQQLWRQVQDSLAVWPLPPGDLPGVSVGLWGRGLRALPTCGRLPVELGPWAVASSAEQRRAAALWQLRQARRWFHGCAVALACALSDEEPAGGSPIFALPPGPLVGDPQGTPIRAVSDAGVLRALDPFAPRLDLCGISLDQVVSGEVALILLQASATRARPFVVYRRVVLPITSAVAAAAAEVAWDPSDSVEVGWLDRRGAERGPAPTGEAEAAPPTDEGETWTEVGSTEAAPSDPALADPAPPAPSSGLSSADPRPSSTTLEIPDYGAVPSTASAAGQLLAATLVAAELRWGSLTDEQRRHLGQGALALAARVSDMKPTTATGRAWRVASLGLTAIAWPEQPDAAGRLDEARQELSRQLDAVLDRQGAPGAEAGQDPEPWLSAVLLLALAIQRHDPPALQEQRGSRYHNDERIVRLVHTLVATLGPPDARGVRSSPVLPEASPDVFRLAAALFPSGHPTGGDGLCAWGWSQTGRRAPRIPGLELLTPEPPASSGLPSVLQPALSSRAWERLGLVLRGQVGEATESWVLVEVGEGTARGPSEHGRVRLHRRGLPSETLDVPWTGSAAPTRSAWTTFRALGGLGLRSFPVDGQAISGARSPDLTIAAIGLEDRRIVVLELGGGRALRWLGPGQDQPWNLCLNRDGRLLAAANRADPLTIWALDGSRPARTLDLHVAWGRHAPGTQGLCFAPGEDLLAVACGDGRARVLGGWDGGVRAVLEAEEDPLLSVAFSPDGRELAVGGRHGVSVWDWEAGRLLARLAVGDARADEVGALGWSPDGTRLAAGGRCERTDWDDGRLVLWERAGAGLAPRWQRGRPGMDSDRRLIRWSPRGDRIAVDNRHIASVLDAADGRILARRDLGEQRRYEPLWELGWTADGAGLHALQAGRYHSDTAHAVTQPAPAQPGTLSSAGVDYGRIELDRGDEHWTRQCLLVRGARSDEPDYVVVRDSARAPGRAGLEVALRAVTAAGVSFEPVSAPTLDRTSLLRAREVEGGPTGYANLAAFSADARRMVSGTHTGGVCLADPREGRVLAVLRARGQPTDAVAISADGRWVAAQDWDGLWLWSGDDPEAEPRRLDAPRKNGRLRGGLNSTLSMDFSPDGARIAACSLHKGVKVFAVEGGEELAAWEDDGEVLAVAWDPTGERLAVGGEAGLSVWTASGRRVLTRASEGLVVRALAWSPDGRTIAAGQEALASDTNIALALWALAGPGGALTAQQPQWRSDQANGDSVLALAYAPDGERLLCAGSQGEARVWQVKTGEGFSLPRPARTPRGACWTDAGEIWLFEANTRDGQFLLRSLRWLADRAARLTVLYPRADGEEAPTVAARADGRGLSLSTSRGTDTILLDDVSFEIKEDRLEFDGEAAVLRARQGAGLLALAEGRRLAAAGLRLDRPGVAHEGAPEPEVLVGPRDVVSLSVNGATSLALRRDGRVLAWGACAALAPGWTDGEDRSLPTILIGLDAIAEVAAGVGFLVLRTRGGAALSSLSLSDGLGALRAVALPGPIRAVAAGASLGLAVDVDGAVWVWGRAVNGALGPQGASDTLTPVRVTGLGAASGVAIAGRTAFALLQDGTVWSWGAGADGLLGDGSSEDRSTPRKIEGLSSIRALSASHRHALALDRDGYVWAWGANEDGRLGDGSVVARPTPVRLSERCVAVAAGEDRSLFLSGEGEVYACGRNTDGQLGTGAADPQTTPAWVEGLAGVTAIGAGAHALALAAGRVYAWGADDRGQLGLGDTAARRSPTQAPEPALGPTPPAGVAQVALGYNVSVALRADGIALSWGYLYRGLLSAEQGRVGPAWPPRRCDAVGGVARLGSTGATIPPLIRADGQPWAHLREPSKQGWECYGGLVAGLPRIRGAAIGDTWAHAVDEEGRVWAWGSCGTGSHGALGLGELTQSLSAPTRLPDLEGAVALATCAGASFALCGDGTVWAWGDNGVGLLGDGAESARATPGRIAGLPPAVAIASCGNHALALDREGRVWAWGANWRGQCGGAAGGLQREPVLVAGIDDVIAVAVGLTEFSLFLRADGSVWSCGYNHAGQLGRATAADHDPVARPIPGLSGVRAIAAGSSHGAALIDGVLWTWGANENGQLGDGSASSRADPRPTLNLEPA